MKAVIYGAGNIGRGFIGQLMSQSGFEVVFLDIADAVIEQLNVDKQYPVVVVSDDGNEEIMVTNVRGVNSRNVDHVVSEILTADVMATSVGVNVLRFIADPLAKAIMARIDAGKAPLNILLCENLIDANHYLKAEIFKHMPEEYQAKFDANVGLVEASIGRMVPVLPKVEGENPLKVCVEAFDILHLDKAGFVGEIPAIKNILPYEPFTYFIQRKLFIHNMCHAITAYLGAQKKYGYIYEAISDVEIKYLVEQAGQESARAIAKATGGDLPDLLDFLHKLLFRFNNSELKDTVERVGRDPIRKLKSIDRIVGAYLLCKEYGLSTVYIDVAIAAALNYSNKNDVAALKVQKEVAKNGVTETLYAFSGTNEFAALDIERINVLYGMVKAGNFRQIVAYCEKSEANQIANK